MKAPRASADGDRPFEDDEEQHGEDRRGERRRGATELRQVGGVVGLAPAPAPPRRERAWAFASSRLRG